MFKRDYERELEQALRALWAGTMGKRPPRPAEELPMTPSPAPRRDRGAPSCRPAATASRPQDPVRPVLTVTVAPGAAATRDVYSGELRARVETDLAFRVGGKLAARLVDAGARVRKGQALARLDPEDAKLAAQAARAQLASAEADLALAKAELERARRPAREEVHQPVRLRRAPGRLHRGAGPRGAGALAGVALRQPGVATRRWWPTPTASWSRWPPSPGRSWPRASPCCAWRATARWKWS